MPTQVDFFFIKKGRSCVTTVFQVNLWRLPDQSSRFNEETLLASHLDSLAQPGVAPLSDVILLVEIEATIMAMKLVFLISELLGNQRNELTNLSPSRAWVKTGHFSGHAQSCIEYHHHAESNSRNLFAYESRKNIITVLLLLTWTRSSMTKIMYVEWV